MRRKNKIIFAALCMIVLLLLIFLLPFDIFSAKKATSYAKNDLTVKQAYEMALSRAKEWDKTAELYYLTSVDNDTNEKMDKQGRRNNWNIHFAVPEKNKSLVISISQKKITNFIEGEDQVNKEEFIFLEEIDFDSPELLVKTKKELDLLPGKDWARGYNYTLKKYEGKPIITVVGLSHQNFFAEVTWDSKSGELITASHKVPSGGGVRVISNDKEAEFLGASQGGVEGLAVSKDERILIQWGYKFINSISPPSYPVIKYTDTEKKEWKELKSPSKEIKNAWFGENNRLFIVSESGIFVSEDGMSEWKLVYKAPSKILDAKSNGKEIIILTENKIILSYDEGTDWKERTVPKGTVKVELINHQIYALTSNQQIHLLNKDQWLLLPENPGKPTFISKYQDKLLASFSDGNIALYNLDTNQWTEILKSELKAVKLFTVENRTSENMLFALLENRKLFKIYKENNSHEWIKKEVFSPTEGTVQSLISIKDDLYIALYPSFDWRKLDKGE